MNERENKKNRNKCRKVTLELFSCENLEGYDEELKTVDISINSRETMKIMRNFLNKMLRKDEEDL